MREADIDQVTVASALSTLPIQFHTKDVSEHPSVTLAHAQYLTDRGYHSTVGRFLSARSQLLGIRLLKRDGGERGAIWERQSTTPPPARFATEVFIVHGHDHATRDAVARFVQRIGLEPIILEEQPDAGLTVIEKFERDAAKVGAAIVLLTPDDLGGAAATGGANPRARQNVIFELGYFAGRLVRGKVVALMRGQVEVPSDYRGVVYTSYDDTGGWRLTIARNLKAAGLPVDPGKLL